MEIKRLRREITELRRAWAREGFCRDLAKNGRTVDGAELTQVREAINAADVAVQSARPKGGAVEELELWRIQKEHLGRVLEKGDTTRGRSARVHVLGPNAWTWN